MSARVRYFAIGAAVVAAAVFAVYWFVLRSDAPDAVSLEGALSTTTTTTAPGDNATTTTTDSVPSDAGLTGTWVIDTSQDTFVGYRVEEELARVGFTTAVGRTPGVSGSLTVDGTTVTAAEFEADLTQLRSDSSNRDGQIRRQALETNDFPTATFALAEPIELGTEPTVGSPFTAEAIGDLTIHGVTNRVTIPLEGQLIDAGSVVVIGSIPILFADYDIDPPSAAVVLSVEDNGIMELQLFFTRQG